MFVTRMPPSTEPAGKDGSDARPAAPPVRPRRWRRPRLVREPDGQNAQRAPGPGPDPAAKPRAEHG